MHSKAQPLPIEARPRAARELREARRAAGLTQETLARLVSLQQCNLAKYESGALPLSAAQGAKLHAAIADVAALREAGQ